MPSSPLQQQLKRQLTTKTLFDQAHRYAAEYIDAIDNITLRRTQEAYGEAILQHTEEESW
jgi:hypothetical protein